MLVHALNVGLFLWWGVWPMVAVEVAGLAAWVLALLIARRGNMGWNFGLATAVGAPKAAAATVWVGWGLGGQYFLLVLVLAMGAVGRRGREEGRRPQPSGKLAYQPPRAGARRGRGKDGLHA